ncbi:MAG: SGNH/GDSL hydrolase family protein [Clostridia bacterium]|nr:SGNH/GDSL hydrolase family protein [Clostridia bacterium]
MANESIEWTNCWREKADRDTKRILLVGDSIIWGAKSFVSKALPDHLAMTAIATSKGVDDPYYVAEIDLLCKQEGYAYEAVYFNNGLHTHGQSPKEYACNYRTALNTLREQIPNAVWILGLSTPIAINPSSGADHDTPITAQDRLEIKEKNDLVLAYNQEVRAIADELSLPCFDAYKLLEEKHAWKTDSYHYNEDGRSYLGRAIADVIQTECQLRRNEYEA